MALLDFERFGITADDVKSGKYSDRFRIYDAGGFLSGFNAEENKAIETLNKHLKETYGDLVKFDENGTSYFDRTKMSYKELNDALQETKKYMKELNGLDHGIKKSLMTYIIEMKDFLVFL